ncbi:hypothetical protein [Tsukamurella sp. PLM1]|uniref:hypothetical protein n=1 Tax=Tsukamurella sp. PLM1 TaxID=2929795 RepID=UPI00206EDF8A|nr:hypothetical protein [Tsukamurella sp. PLM1]BDH58894.1 hypothetical protein MTP03_38330 [Tsukamurella sp. PLM1]
METGHAGRRRDRSDADLLAAAFGADGGPVGPAASPAGRTWLRAVALAGRGRFAAARSLTSAIADGPFASGARCLEASMLRQSGRHRAASGPDGAALALAMSEQPKSSLTVASCVDAAVGLAADALGTGRYALARRLLERADEFLAAPADRASVLVGGGPSGSEPWWTVPGPSAPGLGVGRAGGVLGRPRGGADAVAGLLAADPGLGRPRHHAKTLLIAGSAAMVVGDSDRSRALVAEAYCVAAESGLNPLQWAGAKLMEVLSADGQGEAFVRDAVAVEAKWIRDGAELAR